MALNLYMIGLTAKNMSRSVEFYRRLGVEMPERSEERLHNEVKMPGELTFFLDARPIPSDNPKRMGHASDGHRMYLEFYLGSQAAVTTKYAELMESGYESYHTPFATTFGMYFAFVNDPDGNTVLLSGDLDRAETS
jgi:predicted lactoylglutathione lyase